MYIYIYIVIFVFHFFLTKVTVWWPKAWNKILWSEECCFHCFSYIYTWLCFIYIFTRSALFSPMSFACWMESLYAWPKSRSCWSVICSLIACLLTYVEEQFWTNCVFISWYRSVNSHIVARFLSWVWKLSRVFVLVLTSQSEFVCYKFNILLWWKTPW